MKRARGSGIGSKFFKLVGMEVKRLVCKERVVTGMIKIFNLLVVRARTDRRESWSQSNIVIMQYVAPGMDSNLLGLGTALHAHITFAGME